MQLDGQTALVTGGASGIGKATVLALARAGAVVICADLSEERAAALLGEARTAGLKVEAVAMDLGDPQSTRRAAAGVLERHARIDVLVNAAGWGDIQPYMQIPPEYMERIIAINLAGPVHLTQALLAPMIAAGKGKIINVASDAGRVGSSGETVYAAAKLGPVSPTSTPMRPFATAVATLFSMAPDMV